MKQYLDLLQNILDNGTEKKSARQNLPNTLGISHAVIRMDLQKGFPLLTTKKMYWKGIVAELLWFLKGDTNIKYLVDNDCNIWNKDAYRWYLKQHEAFYGVITLGEGEKTPLSFDRFVSSIKEVDNIIRYANWFDTDYTLGDLGKVYGHQWRNQNGIDQVAEVLEGLKKDPFSRYHIIDAWNKADFKDMALPPCHLLYQFIVREDISDECFVLDLNMYQRSCDSFLGVPFNLASMALMLRIFAQASGMTPGIATWIGGDTHIYVDHIPMVHEQLQRKPFNLPELSILKDLNSLEDILNLKIEDFVIHYYRSYTAIKAELFSGLKK